jgi:hypothetical protein
MAVQRLTAAYRSRPRPSSTPGAKASTVSPYYLDGVIKELPICLGHVQFSRSTEAHAAVSPPAVSQN